MEQDYWRLLGRFQLLLALAKRYASECGTCEGRGFCIEPIDHEEIDCNDCADIRATIAKAEGGA
jgi:hypothetical protein